MNIAPRIEKAHLLKMITGVLSGTDSKWLGSGVPAGRFDFYTDEVREKIQEEGVKNGCHSCNMKLSEDRNQPWVGDHIPPTDLDVGLKMVLNLPVKVHLFPQCHECSNFQAWLVKTLNSKCTKSVSEAEKFLEEDKKRLPYIKGGKEIRPEYCIESTQTYVTPTEGRFIQALGETNGCHTCNTFFPASVYHADHVFPKEFCTPYMKLVFASLEIKYPDSFEFRPQCPRCSSAQGGLVAQVTKMANLYIEDNKDALDLLANELAKAQGKRERGFAKYK
jgi:hypothetical protein